LWQKLLAFGEKLARTASGRLEFEFEVRVEGADQAGGYEELQGLWASTIDGRIRGLVSLSEAQKVAFLMGMHERLGAGSAVHMLSRDTAELVLAGVQRQRLCVAWTRAGPR
jgi:hypothetical protein